jgi:dihydropteroate synthase
MFTLNCRERLLTIEQPVVMGIINMTPESFYPGSRANDVDTVLFRAEKMVEEGALILDVGGQSTRPGSETVNEEEELHRVLPAIQAISKRFPGIFISVDTFYSNVLRAAVDSGASIANDVSAGTMDQEFIATVAELRIPYVLMHMKGHPRTMQMNPTYDQVVLDVFDRLNSQLAGLTSAGIRDIIIDPGFGFGKTIQHNFELLRELSFFRQLEKPLMVGLSRKATIYKTLGIGPEAALNGSTVLHTIALLNGAAILRVHDVKEATQAVRLVNEYLKDGGGVPRPPKNKEQ